MSAVATYVNVEGLLQAASGGTLNYAPPQLLNLNSVAQVQSVALTSSWVEVTLPANTLFWGVAPPLGNSVAISHKWASGDTGSAISASAGIPVAGADPSGLTFYLKSASPVTVEVWSF